MQKIIPILLKLAGAAFLAVGLVAAYYGPLEIYVFYLFSEGGRFYYQGFGMGALWFAALVIQNLGYYVIAALLLPLAIGHLGLRRWALPLARLYLWFWLGAGLLLAVILVGLAPATFRLGLPPAVLALRLGLTAAAVVLLLILAPVLGLLFYRSAPVRAAFTGGPNPTWIESYPMPLLAVLLLFFIMIVVLHLAMFFQAVFPLFGIIMLGRPAVPVIAACIVILGILIYGLVRRESWAWWASLVFVALLAVSAGLSFARYGLFDILQRMQLPPAEIEFMRGAAALQDFNLTALVTLPLLVTLGLLVYSKRYFPASAASPALRKA
jgi:hypothetical protein